MQEFMDIYTAERVYTGESVVRQGAHLQEGQFMLYALAIIEDTQGNFLITQRNQDKSWGAGWWEVPGGGVLSGEDTFEAIVREVREEVGLDVSAQNNQPVYSYQNVDLDGGDNYITDIFHFHLDFSPADVVLQVSESQDFKLATLEEITVLHDQGIFLHYQRICQALATESLD